MPRLPVGSHWRILAHGVFGPVAIESTDYSRVPVTHDYTQRLSTSTVLDELVIDEWLHLEQMDTRRWCLAIGDDLVMIEIGKDGRPKMGEWYK